MRRLLVPVLLLTAAFLSVPTAASADTGDFTFDSFTADYTLSRADDGTSQLRVVETIVARFPDFDQNRGIIRAIPDDYDGVYLDTRVESVVDENGTPVYFESDRTRDFLELALGTDEFVRGVNTYVITYTQQDVVRSFDDTNSDEFYWDVNGTGWSQPFGVVSATLTVDPSLVSALSGRQACYSGPRGSTDLCAIDSGDDGRFAVSVPNLGPGENVTIAVGFTPDTFFTPEPTPSLEKPIPVWLDVFSGALGLAGIGGMIAAIVARRRSGRGAPGRGTIIAQHTEPEGITIMQAAHLEKKATRAIPAALVRLAVRGNIRILTYAVDEGDDPYTLQYLTDQGAGIEDKAILDIVFGANPAAGATSPFGDSQQVEAKALLALSARANQSLVTEGFQQRAAGLGLAIALVAVQVVLGIVAMFSVVISAAEYFAISNFIVPTMFVGLVTLLVTIFLASRPLRFTAKGAEADEFLRGMQLYLTIAEKDRLRALQSPQGAERVDAGNNLEMIKLYEKLLPWAVLWGVEDQWMRELAVRVETESIEPDWFVSRSGFNAALFSSTVSGFNSTLFPVSTTSSWSGSGGGSFGGGSFGGGFSGGGGGGGGGGGR